LQAQPSSPNIDSIAAPCLPYFPLVYSANQVWSVCAEKKNASVNFSNGLPHHSRKIFNADELWDAKKRFMTK
jgi:hypothetical protein